MFNRVEAIGNIGSDVEMRYTPNGNPVTTFRFATNHSYTDSAGEKRTETEWFTVVAWNKLAELCNEYLEKGKRCYVEGRLKSQTWTGQDGQSRFRNEIIASKVLFLDRRTESDGGAADADISEELPW